MEPQQGVPTNDLGNGNGACRVFVPVLSFPLIFMSLMDSVLSIFFSPAYGQSRRTGNLVNTNYFRLFLLAFSFSAPCSPFGRATLLPLRSLVSVPPTRSPTSTLPSCKYSFLCAPDGCLPPAKRVYTTASEPQANVVLVRS